MPNDRSQTAEAPVAEGRNGHVALYMQSFAGGGAERVMVNLAQGLAARGLRVDMVVARAEGPYMSLLTPDIRLVDLQCRRSLASLPGLARYLRREKPDALLSALGMSNLIALWARAASGFRGRVVVSVHINLSVHYRHARRLSDKIFMALFRRFYPLADAVVAVSEEAAQDLTRSLGLPPECVRMIYNPVVSAALLQQAKAAVEHQWFGPGKLPVVLAAGRLCAQKDFLTLIHAFAILRKRTPARLVILGEGPERSQLEAAILAQELGDCVDLPGFVPNPYAYMAQSATYVLSSRWEGLPTVLIEALACGARVVSTDCPSGPREILQEGRYGSLVPVGDPEAMALALEAALRGHGRVPPLRSLSAFGSARAAANYEKVLLRG